MCTLVSAAVTIEVERLTQENATLRQEVERLKQQLVAAEIQNGGTWYMQCMLSTISCYYFASWQINK